jgi:hypothetical protein
MKNNEHAIRPAHRWCAVIKRGELFNTLRISARSHYPLNDN